MIVIASTSLAKNAPKGSDMMASPHDQAAASVLNSREKIKYDNDTFTHLTVHAAEWRNTRQIII
jgi:hypothetical protein